MMAEEPRTDTTDPKVPGGTSGGPHFRADLQHSLPSSDDPVPDPERRAAGGGPQSEPTDPRWQLLGQWIESGAARRAGLYPLPADLRLSVVIPVYNEVASVAETLRLVRAVPIPKEIILVDDGSTDGTRDLLARWEGQPDLRIILHEHNQGKGAAITTGFRHVTGDIVIIQDADREYDPAEYPRLIQPIVEGKADVVYGSRFLGDGSHRVLYFWHYLGNKVLTTLSNMFTNLNLTDMETGYKVFRREVIEAITPTLKQKRFGIEPEMTAKVARRRYRIFETAIGYSGRTYSEGKKIGWRDGFKALWCIVRYWKWD